MTRLTRESPIKSEIIKMACSLFLERGFTSATVASISNALGISTGNLTYHFPTKEHLLLELVKEMCGFQWETVSKYIDRWNSPLLVYALEIATQIALCEENKIAYEVYVSSYTQPLTLAEIRDWSAKKAQKLFSEYNPDWEESDYMFAAINASGLELAALMTECGETVTLDKKIENTLNGLMKIYNVPENKREFTIRRVLRSDYRSVSRTLLCQFTDHIAKTL